MACFGIEFTDLFPAEAGAPNGVAGDVRVHRISKHLAVDLQIAAPLSFFAPERIPSKRAIFGIEVFGPQLRRFHDVRIAIKYCKTLASHNLSTPLALENAVSLFFGRASQTRPACSVPPGTVNQVQLFPFLL
jgi:hypothetical protein